MIYLKKLITTQIFAMLLTCFTVNSTAHGAEEIVVEPPQEVERWFAALGSVNRRDFDALIDKDAVIVLKDLGINQSKQEFIAALDEWENATRDANIIYRYKSINNDKASVQVCYRFKSNEQLNSEQFEFAEGRITGSVQELKSNNCGDM